MTAHAPGDTVHGYRIVRTLGRGGLGTTFEATRESTGESVALKRLKVSDADAWKRIELFEREAAVLARLTHPAIPRYIDHFTVDGDEGPVLYIAQELVAGRSLGDVVRENGAPMAEPEVRRIADELLSVLDYLGAQVPPVIHRDLKPENILLRSDGSAALVDFGAARVTVAAAEGGSTTVGTYGYMAPEQLQGIATPATDIYGLGCTLLFLLTGESPTDLPRQRLRISFRERARVTEPFAAWLDKALEPASEDRFASASEARTALRSGIAKTSIALTPKRRLLPLVLGMAATGALASGVFMAKRTGPLGASTCPELANLDPKLTALSESELEARLRASAMLPPSMNEKQLDSIRASGSMYAPEKRACMLRLSLISSVVSQEQMRSTMPTMWGLGHTPKELRELYLSLPLRADYTPEQRQDVLDQVEKNFIPSLRADSEGDSDFWRRQYYGVVVVCDASDEGLAKIHATRPRDADCLRLKPRGGVVPPPKTRESDTGEPSAPAVVIGIKVCDDLVARWATCDPPKLGWTPATLKRDYAWTDDPTKAATERRCKAQLENFPESACHYRK